MFNPDHNCPFNPRKKEPNDPLIVYKKTDDQQQFVHHDKRGIFKDQYEEIYKLKPDLVNLVPFENCKKCLKTVRKRICVKKEQKQKRKAMMTIDGDDLTSSDDDSDDESTSKIKNNKNSNVRKKRKKNGSTIKEDIWTSTSGPNEVVKKVIHSPQSSTSQLSPSSIAPSSVNSTDRKYRYMSDNQ